LNNETIFLIFNLSPGILAGTFFYQEICNYLGGGIEYQIIMTPSPTLPLKEKGDQPHKLLQRSVRWHPPFSGGFRKLSGRGGIR